MVNVCTQARGWLCQLPEPELGKHGSPMGFVMHNKCVMSWPVLLSCSWWMYGWVESPAPLLLMVDRWVESLQAAQQECRILTLFPEHLHFLSPWLPPPTQLELSLRSWPLEESVF